MNCVWPIAVQLGLRLCHFNPETEKYKELFNKVFPDKAKIAWKKHGRKVKCLHTWIGHRQARYQNK